MRLLAHVADQYRVRWRTNQAVQVLRPNRDRVDAKLLCITGFVRTATYSRERRGTAAHVQATSRKRCLANRDSAPTPPRAAADCGDPGQGGRAAGQAPRRPRPTRHPHPIHLPRHVRRPRHESEGVAASRSIGEARRRRSTDGEHLTPRRTTRLRDGASSAWNMSRRVSDFDNVDYVDAMSYGALSRRCNAIAGDVLILRIGTIGRVAVVETARRSLWIRQLRSASSARRHRVGHTFCELPSHAG